MTRWFRRADAGSDGWFEAGDDSVVVRQASFDEPHGTASVAASRDELAWVHEQFGTLGAGLYTARYGALLNDSVEDDAGPVTEAVTRPIAEPVTEAEFEQAWRRARHGRNTSPPGPGGPLPQGTRLTGTVGELPWGPGRTGLFVDLGLPIHCFVDLTGLPLDPGDWPAVGTVTEFEVTTVHFNFESGGDPQIRLQPTATPPPGRPWPRPGRP
ncbi:hypothetical protein [Streptomyces sp. NPDC021622]|uniref:hypothetical protein n=1 Tax=Streptomyces sp. NPDC021622 TaxID=3155013 RepID=UPI0033D7D2C2